jgi:murein DD-endopeptidase MepM/ murein hydrolase activator NlpD
MHIEIHVPRPGVTLLAVAAVSGWAMYFFGGMGAAAEPVIEKPTAQLVQESSSSVAAAPVAGAQQALVEKPFEEETHVHPAVMDDSVDLDELQMSQADMRMRWARSQQDFLNNREELLREQLEGLQQQREALGDSIDPQLEEQFRQSVKLLTSLVQDRQKAESFLIATYKQMWEAEERAMAITSNVTPTKEVRVLWPVEPTLGISAGFLDEAYKQRFKVDHYAIDIPTNQGTPVLAAADGVVKDVVDHGLGYNYVTIDHGGYATTYGHLSAFDVRPGQRVRTGDKLGDSGGTPGLPGGGSSTGPHLHFALSIKGKPVDPSKYLPKP